MPLVQPRLAPGVLSKGRAVTPVLRCADPLQGIGMAAGSCALMLVDESVLAHEATRAIASAAAQAGRVETIALPCGEVIKQPAAFESLRVRTAGLDVGAVLLVGGGTLINLGLYWAAGGDGDPACPACAIVPTNTMAIADVALGGLGMLNDANGRKNARRRKRDPDAVYLCPQFLERAPDAVRRDGVVEVLKHCLLQHAAGIDEAATLYLSVDPSASNCYDTAVAGLWMKADCLGLIAAAGEDDVEFAISYGHLHAHTIEEHWHGRVAHAPCVLIGLLIDLRLGGAGALAESLAVQASRSVLAPRLRELLREERIAAYLQDYPTNGRFHAGAGSYWTIGLPANRLGRVVVADGIDLRRRRVSLTDIAESYRALSALF